jgi:hypothetical protein
MADGGFEGTKRGSEREMGVRLDVRERLKSGLARGLQGRI